MPLLNSVTTPYAEALLQVVNENDPSKAKAVVEEMCKKLLANLVIENFKIIETQ